MVIYEKATVKLDYNQAKKQLTQTWTGFSSTEVFREAIDKTASFMKTNLVTTIISDTLKQSVVKPEDTQYAASIMPTLFKSGLKAMAFIMPQNVLTQMSLKGFDSAQKNDNVQFFASVAEAQKWLETMAI